jgi:hypothetical protein
MRIMDEGSYEDQGGSYKDQIDQDPSSPVFSDTAPTAKEVEGILANQGPVDVVKEAEDKPPTLGVNQQLQDKEVKIDALKAEIYLPISCKNFSDESKTGEATRQVVKFSIAEVSNQTVLELKCETPSRRNRGRSLAAGDAARYTFAVEIPEGTDASVIESNLKTAAGNGVLLNTIKSKAVAAGVATEALLFASPILVIQLKQGTVTKTVQVVVDMPKEEPTEEKDNDGLSDGEIAAIVICTLIFVTGVSIGLWAYCKQMETPGKPNNEAGKPSQPQVYMGGDAIPGAEAENQLEQKIDAPGYNV